MNEWVYKHLFVLSIDNSNIQGVDPVSAMVTFVDGKADKKDIENIKLKQLTDLMTTNQ